MARFGTPDGFDPSAIMADTLFGWVDPEAASESAGDITLDVENGARLTHTHTMSGSGTLLVPLNMPDGSTIDLLIDPDGNTLSFDSGYEGSGDTLPDVTEETLLVIKRVGSRYLVVAVGSGFGDGS